MKNIKKTTIVFTIMFLLISYASFAQSSIKGTVKDNANQPIPGVNVLLEGSTKGANTDFDGNYEITNVKDGEYKMIVSSLGYKTISKEVKINGNNITVDFIIEESTDNLDEVVVTGVVNPKSKLESSVSVSSIGAKTIAQSVPRTTGEIFRSIPGVRAESSSGDGNANFNVRGVPVSSGGSRYLQLQEDGLPINLFGDTSFGNSDNFLRADANIERVESIRGGSASTQASNGPAGIINMISKTGNVKGGSASTNIGLDYNSNRVDFEYGSPIGEDLSFHIGGFMRTGEGPRSAGFTANKGGQLKANITKRFKSGYVRTYFKLLNDRAAMYMPMPMLLKGSDDNPTYGNLPGFDITTDGLQTKYLQESVGLSSNDNSRRIGDVRDGSNPRSTAIGLEFSFDIGDGWKVKNKGRYAMNSGTFMAPFSANFGQTANVLAAVDGALSQDLSSATLSYADNGNTYNPANGLMQVIHLFDVDIENLSNFINDIKISKKLSDDISVTAGYFRATQNTKTSWQWNSYLQEVKGDGEARLVNIDGLSRGGQFAYGTPVWGNCCQRKYNTVHSVDAPYLALDINITEDINFDGSIRYDNVRVDGTIADVNTPQNFDINGNGTIEPIEEVVPVVQPNQNKIIGDKYDFVSFSGGINYKLNDDSALFARYSQGASGRAPDRNGYGLDGTSQTQYDQVSQMELGYKRRLKAGSINLTGFLSNTDEDAGSALNLTVGNEFRAYGLELEGAYNFGNFFVGGSATWTDAEITEDRASGTGANKGNTPQRQAGLVYNFNPTYSFGKKKQHILGLTILGTTKSYAFDDNKLVQPGYAYLNLLGRVGLTEGLSLSLNINNIFDTVGITEVNGIDGTNGTDRYVRARSITGRSTSLTLRYDF